ncbi:LysE family transporter [Pelagibacteraceae bacterium]|nr:LysE family transporter [Pelagibacteraceae bacterium]
MITYLSGLLVGFLVALPVGAIAMICINRTLQYGKISGYFSGLGAATADLIYGLIAIYSLTAISGQALVNQPVLKLAGGLCIIFIGARMMIGKKSSSETVLVTHETNIKDFISTFLITLSNPITMIAFVVALSNINYLFQEINFIHSSILVLGIFSGSMLWWVILVNISLSFKKYLSNLFVRRINIVSGLIILCIGLYLIISI